jgi:hypothetical protein
MLADYVVPTVPVRAASSAGAALEAAGALGYPVALKTAAPGVRHKSDVDGVRLGIGDAADLEQAYRDVAARLGPEVVVTPMAPDGVEVALGIVRDPQFGPLVVAGAGGILVELLADRRIALPPVDEREAVELIGRLRMRPLLEGARGRPPADVASLGHAISRLSVLAADLGEHLDGLDANPVIVSAGGCVAVDALVVARMRST